MYDSIHNSTGFYTSWVHHERNQTHTVRLFALWVLSLSKGKISVSLNMSTLWHEFWFKTIDARQYAVLRILFGSLSCVYFCQLLPYVTSQFSQIGWLANHSQIASQNGGSWSLFFVSVNACNQLFAYLLACIGIVAAFLMALGWQSQISSVITWLIWVSFWNRNPLILDGDDAVLKMMCFYLMLSSCGKAWSLDAFLHKQNDVVTVWPLRLMQYQLALIYFVSGWVKFYSVEWNDGAVLRYVLIHPQYSRFDGWALSQNEFVQAILAWLANVIRWWEVLFPALLICPMTRKFNIIMGVVFHLGLGLTMNLRWFPMVMLAFYPALLPNDVFFNIEQQLKRKLQRS